MSSAGEGRQSPPPERQTAEQMSHGVASGQGADKVDPASKKNEMQDQLKNLTSNPEGPMDRFLEEKFHRNKVPATETK